MENSGNERLAIQAFNAKEVSLSLSQSSPWVRHSLIRRRKTGNNPLKWHAPTQRPLWFKEEQEKNSCKPSLVSHHNSLLKYKKKATFYLCWWRVSHTAWLMCTNIINIKLSPFSMVLVCFWSGKEDMEDKGSIVTRAKCIFQVSIQTLVIFTC